MGLAPLEQSGQPPFLLDLMKDNELIDRRVISFALHNTNTQSLLAFGEPDMSLVPEGARNGSVPLTSKGILYFVRLYESKIGSHSLGTSEGTIALIDTGTSLIGIPTNELNTLLAYY